MLYEYEDYLEAEETEGVTIAPALLSCMHCLKRIPLFTKISHHTMCLSLYLYFSLLLSDHKSSSKTFLFSVCGVLYLFIYQLTISPVAVSFTLYREFKNRLVCYDCVFPPKERSQNVGKVSQYAAASNVSWTYVLLLLSIP